MTAPRAGAPGAGGGGGASDDAPAAGPRLAELWLACYERLAAAAAHEVNNALNGVAMNLEVVRLRARPGGDAGGLASFADAALSEQDATAALAGALVALGRSPRDSATDVAEVLRHASTLYAPLLRHRGVTLAVDGGGPAPTAAPAHAVRLAVCTTLEAAWAAAAGRAGAPSERAGTDDPAAALRCNLFVDQRSTLVVRPAPPAWSDDVGAALAEAGVETTRAPDGVRVAFLPA